MNIKLSIFQQILKAAKTWINLDYFFIPNKYLKDIFSLNILLGSIFISPIVAEDGKFHAIIAADLSAPNLEQVVERDLERMQSQMRRIAKYTQLEVCEKVFLGQSSDPANICNYIEQLKINSDDVLLFYFSGHGYHTDQDTINWPSLDFNEADLQIDFKDIAEALMKKEARLTLLLSDCCNTKLSLKQTTQKIKLKAKKGADRQLLPPIIERYRKLFLQPKGVLMIASASANEYAFGADEEGSLFTKAFTQELQRTEQNEEMDVSWHLLLENVQQNLQKVFQENDLTQNPFILNAIIE